MAKYLPLEIINVLEKGLYDLEKIAGCKISYEALSVLSELYTMTKDNMEEIMDQLAKYPEMERLLEISNTFINKMGTEAFHDDLRADINATAIVGMWSRNKQVFHLDRDFTDELIKTDKIRLTKDFLDYLPYQYFYVDISDNEELAEKVRCEGFFVHVVKNRNVGEGCDERYDIQGVKIERDKESGKPVFYSDTTSFANTDKELGLNDIENTDNVRVAIYNDNETTILNKEVDGRLFQILVLQTLLYLTQEPQNIDIRESEITKNTYKKPFDEKKPRNKFSEVRIQDVGVRWGNAFRLWREQKKKEEPSSETGLKKKPHVRRAHWHHYWCNRKDEYGNEIFITNEFGEKEKAKALRRVWLSEISVNIERDTELPVTKHKVKREAR